MAAYSARRSSGPVQRSISPSPRFNRHTSSFHSSSSSAFSLSLDRPGSPNRSISVSSRPNKSSTASTTPKRTCMCSPTNHPGSFRCSLHKSGFGRVSNNSQTVSCRSSSRLNMRRSAMKNSLVRIGTVEGDLVKRALAALIRPSSHQQRRRGEFRPRPSRLSTSA
ncbi:hypothetical protein ACJIZ3_020584 [Penstemon smallii]|uniref:Serine-rich protein-like protein n=1 Tax=Penstemon smallii TaxID=265156 RepID=A0ABD3SJ07_9LAMI